MLDILVDIYNEMESTWKDIKGLYCRVFGHKWSEKYHFMSTPLIYCERCGKAELKNNIRR